MTTQHELACPDCGTTLVVRQLENKTYVCLGNTAIKVALEDEAAGAFLVISQESEEHTGKIIVELEELRAVLATAEKMIAEYPE